jgi:methionine sulfoxide reductase catalytic subunit
MDNKNPDIPSNEITPENVYFNRRKFLRAGLGVASVAATALIYRQFNRPILQQSVGSLALPPDATAPLPAFAGGQPATNPSMNPSTEPITEPMITAAPERPAWATDEPKTSYQNITHWNNFYEFSTEKQDVADLAAGFSTAGWKLSVGGLCRKPIVLDLDDLLKIAPPEERVYRMRCVERWSMVIPWNGFPISKLLDRVRPLSSAKYVAFESVLDRVQMPNQKADAVLPWPYLEGLRMDEAMHPLAILAIGIYGRILPPQDGAPIRLVVPWKYGLKGAKSLVKITLTDTQPPTTWSTANPPAYGFYCNVNPNVDRPWDQSIEDRLGVGSRPTLMFNGYSDQVASLYSGMDLSKYY